MSQILNCIGKISFRLSAVILLLSCGNCFAQYTVKHTLKDGMPVAETSEYYTYNRSGDEYNALSFKLNMAGKAGSKANVFNLNLIYTSTLQQIPQKMVFRAVSDSSLNIAVNLAPTGTKAIDNPKFKSNLYTIAITDSLKTFLTHQQLKQVLLFDAQGQPVCGLNVTEPSFLIQQFTILQAPQAKQKPVIKKPRKHSS